MRYWHSSFEKSHKCDRICHGLVVCKKICALKKLGWPLLELAQHCGMMSGNTGGAKMSTAKIAITIEKGVLKRLDRLVKSQVFPNRSKAIQEAVQEKMARMDRSRLARECARLDPRFEQALAEEGFSREIDQWPEY